jgi:hypothetical protein
MGEEEAEEFYIILLTAGSFGDFNYMTQVLEFQNTSLLILLINLTVGVMNHFSHNNLEV